MAISMSHITTATNTGGGTSLSYSSVNIGTAADDRIVVVVANAESSSGTSQASSCTIGGVSATRHVFTNQEGGGVAIFTRNVTSGTSATIVVNYTVSQFRGMVGIWRLTGATETPVDTDLQEDLTGSTGFTYTVDIPADAVAICGESKGDADPVGWSGATERYDSAPGASQFYGADVAATGSDRNGYTISTSYEASFQAAGGAVAVFASASEEASATVDIDSALSLSPVASKVGNTTTPVNVTTSLSPAAAKTGVVSSDIITGLSISAVALQRRLTTVDIPIESSISPSATKTGVTTTSINTYVVLSPLTEKFASATVVIDIDLTSTQASEKTGVVTSSIDVSSSTVALSGKTGQTTSAVDVETTLSSPSAKTGVVASLVDVDFTISPEAEVAPEVTSDVNFTLSISALAAKKVPTTSSVDIETSLLVDSVVAGIQAINIIIGTLGRAGRYITGIGNLSLPTPVSEALTEHNIPSDGTTTIGVAIGAKAYSVNAVGVVATTITTAVGSIPLTTGVVEEEVTADVADLEISVGI